MTSEVMQHLFNALDTVNWEDHSHSQNVSRGTGASLSVAQKIIGQMGGSLRVTSALNRGSTFRFDVGLSLSPQPDEVGARTCNAIAIGSGSSSDEGSGNIYS